MNSQEANNLVIKTFESSFDEGKFTYFIKNLLNNIDDSESKKFEYHGQYIPASFRDSIKQYKRIGQYEGPNNNLIDILIVNLKKESTLERARTFQRNFIAWYLKQKTREAALVAYWSEGFEDWRFSLVKLDFNLNKTKIEIELSPAKRYSFLVGANERSHTAQSQFQKILTGISNPSLDELEQAFNIETVTKEFFEEYRNLFIHIKLALDKVIKNDSKIKNEFDSKSVNSVDFSKKLLGQIIFLYFLQKKGWFGVERDSDWGTGSKKFLRELLNKKHGDYNNFFNDILEPLFYEALRYDRQDYYYSRFNCKIPFLNGGLFDPINNYDWVHTDITLPNELFSNNSKTPQGDTGDGIFDIFDRYNFTVIEDEPLEKEVAIDPELLGKAYEKFNAIRPDNFNEYRKVLKSGKKGAENKFNKQYGVYYTPREIVHYMCRESLINYLASEFCDRTDAYQKVSTEQLDAFGNTARKGQLKLEAEYKPNPFIKKEDIETLINYGELFGENEAVVVSNGVETGTYSHKLPESIRKNAALIDEKLADILVCDPAVGSGAFPVGMMHEIVGARNILSIFIQDRKATTYHFKRECIEKSLYGVDIDSGAVEIAKLRLWLSLVVDEDNFKEIKPLPNLDYKIIKGNSLLGFPDGVVKNVDIEEKIESLKIQYFKVTDVNEKRKLKADIESNFSKLIAEASQFSKNALDISFDFRFFFSEVFHHKEGFDIIIANPPYGADIPFNEKEYLKKKHDNIVERIRNSFLYFIGESYNLVKINGIVCFIIPNEFLFQIYMTKARRFFLKNSCFLFAINLGEDIFDAIVPTAVFAFKKAKEDDYLIPSSDLRTAKLEELTNLLVTSNFAKIPKSQLLSSPNSTFSFDANVSKLINKISKSSAPFENFCDDVANGISTSCDDVYIASFNFIKQNELEKEYLEPCIRGFQIDRYYCPLKSDDYILYITNEFKKRKAPNIYNYLSKNKKLLIEKSVEKKQGKRDWHILFRSRYRELFSKPKIIIRQTGDRIISTIDDKIGYYCIDSTNVAQIKSKYHKYLAYLIGLLNSRLMVFYYQAISQEKNRVLAQVKPQRVRALPIIIGTENQIKSITDLVLKITSKKEDDPEADTMHLEDQIDKMVYRLYDLTFEEVKMIDPEIDKVISKEDYERFEIK